jgi:hypothetical protein
MPAAAQRAIIMALYEPVAWLACIFRNVYVRAGTPFMAPSAAANAPLGGWMKKPVPHELHCCAPCTVHPAPVAAAPPAHVHTLGAQPKSDVPVVLHEPVRCCPAGHDARHAAQT